MNKWGRYGQRLRKARNKLKWSLDDVAIYFNLSSKVNVLRYESGERYPEDFNTRGNMEAFIQAVERMKKQEASDKYGPKLAQKKALLEAQNCPRKGDTRTASGNFSPGKNSMNFMRPRDGVKHKVGNFSPGNYRKKGGVVTSDTNAMPSGAEINADADTEVENESRFKPLPDLVAAKVKGTERCILCGNIRQSNSNYWADLPEWIINRALVLLQVITGDMETADFVKGYGSGILDLLAALMSKKRTQLLAILNREGYVDAFLARPPFDERLERYRVLFPPTSNKVERKRDGETI